MPKKTKKAATHFRVNQEIKFLYTKKKLNEQLYKLHLECATHWNVKWHTIRDTIDNKLQQLMESHYNHLNKKLDKLQIKILQHPELKQSTIEHTNKVRQRFYPRVKNLTNINLTKEEMDVLNYGAQYSIGKPITSYLPNLIAETKKKNTNPTSPSYIHRTARPAFTNMPMRYTVYEMMLLMMDW